MSEDKQEIQFDIDEKLATVKYRSCSESHLKPDQQKCRLCVGKPCTTFCPACVYSWSDEENSLYVRHENCLECGACRIGCPHKAIEWKYPPGGKGVTFKQG